MADIVAMEWAEGKLHLLDQTALPDRVIYLDLESHTEVVTAIREMRVRGAPALGVVSAYAMVLASRQIEREGNKDFSKCLREAAREVEASRPTAVNIRWAVERMLRLAETIQNPTDMCAGLLAEAKAIQEEDISANRRIGCYGAELLSDYGSVLTHCNTGSLATGGYGTALGVIRRAWDSGQRLQVFHTETRPFLQGARLTAWELIQLGIPATMVVDSAAGLLLKEHTVDCVIVGADRIAANGDTANKIGTYSLAVVAKENGIPFYVAAPTSTIDVELHTGDQIPIEQREPTEVTHVGETRTAAEGIGIQNPAFDVTPHRYITAIVTEEGVVREPYRPGLLSIVRGSQ